MPVLVFAFTLLVWSSLPTAYNLACNSLIIQVAALIQIARDLGEETMTMATVIKENI